MCRWFAFKVERQKGVPATSKEGELIEIHITFIYMHRLIMRVKNCTFSVKETECQ